MLWHCIALIVIETHLNQTLKFTLEGFFFTCIHKVLRIGSSDTNPVLKESPCIITRLFGGTVYVLPKEQGANFCVGSIMEEQGFLKMFEPIVKRSYNRKYKQIIVAFIIASVL